MDETEGVSDEDMTENRDIPDHPWPNEEDVRNGWCQKGFLANALCLVSFSINVFIRCEVQQVVVMATFYTLLYFNMSEKV